MRALKSQLGKAAAVAAVLAALIVVPALAAPTETGTLSAAAPTFSWDGGPASGFSDPTGETSAVNPSGRPNLDCGNDTYHCDFIALKLEVGGDLQVALSDAAGESDPSVVLPTDLDLFLYKSNEAGEPQGDPIAKQADGEANEKVTAKNLPAGNYVAVIEYWWAVEATYKGKATLTPAATAEPTATPTETPTVAPTAQPTPPPAAQPQPQPAQQPPATNPQQRRQTQPQSAAAKRKAALKKCNAKAKRIKKPAKRKKALKACAKKYRR